MVARVLRKKCDGRFCCIAATLSVCEMNENRDFGGDTLREARPTNEPALGRVAVMHTAPTLYVTDQTARAVTF